MFGYLLDFFDRKEMSFPADIPAVRKGKCFRCGNEGHWAADCSQKSVCFSQPNRGQVSADGGGAGNEAPGIICKCGAGVIQPRVARNSGKVYYVCPAESWMRCDFFMWQSQLKSCGVKQLQYPMCSCARVCVLASDPGTGRRYFKCGVPEGQGACSFRQWVVSRSTTDSMDIDTNHLSTPPSLGKHPILDGDDSRGKCLKITERDGSPKTNSDRFCSNSAPSLVCSDSKESVVKDPPAITLKEPSAPRSPPYVAEPDNVTAAAIMEAFGQAATDIQSKFLTRLESMDPSCHEAMVKEANTAFANLDHLKVDYIPFYQQVKDFIDAAATLTQIDNSMCNDVLFHDYLDRCNHEKLRLEQLSTERDSVVNSLTRSQAHLQTLHNEAEEVRNRLLQIENQVSACNSEITDLQNHLAELSGQINKCEDNLQSASREAEAAKKISIQRAVELSAAWDVFENAKLQLRNEAT